MYTRSKSNISKYALDTSVFGNTQQYTRPTYALEIWRFVRGTFKCTRRISIDFIL